MMLFWGLHYQGTTIPGLFEILQNGNFQPMHLIQKIFGPIYFFWSALKVQPCDIFQKMFQDPSKCLKLWIKVNWIILKMHHSIWKILFVLGTDEYVERLEGKTRKRLFCYVKIF